MNGATNIPRTHCPACIGTEDEVDTRTLLLLLVVGIMVVKWHIKCNEAHTKLMANTLIGTTNDGDGDQADESGLCVV